MAQEPLELTTLALAQDEGNPRLVEVQVTQRTLAQEKISLPSLFIERGERRELKSIQTFIEGDWDQGLVHLAIC